MKKVNVLNLVEYFNLGGIERLLEQLALNFNDKYNLSFFSYESEELTGIGRSLSQKGYEVSHCKKKPGYDFKLLLRLIKLVRKNKIDIIHTHDFGPIEYALLVKLFCPKIQLIHTQHTLHHFVINKKYTMFFQFASLFYKNMISVSDHVKNELLKFCPLSKSKLNVIHNGVDTNYFLDTALKSPETQKLKMISVSRISKEKNLKFTMMALSKLKSEGVDFEFHHAGSGDKENERELKKLIDDLSLKNEVFLYGFQNDCRDVLSKGNIFLSSSITEGHPVSVLEAMSLSKICIVSDINPHLEIDSGEFITFNNQVIDELVQVIKSAKERVIKLLESAKNNRKYVEENYSLELMINKYSSQYDKVLER